SRINLRRKRGLSSTIEQNAEQLSAWVSTAHAGGELQATATCEGTTAGSQDMQTGCHFGELARDSAVALVVTACHLVQDIGVLHERRQRKLARGSTDTTGEVMVREFPSANGVILKRRPYCSVIVAEHYLMTDWKLQ